MINANSGGLDPSNARPFASYAGGQPQGGGGDGSYPPSSGAFGGLQGGFGLQGPGSRQRPGLGGMPSLGGQPGAPGQGRFASGNLSNQLQQQLGQQYGQAGGRGGGPGSPMLAMNGLGAPGRGSPAPPAPPGQQRGSLDLGGGLGLAGGFGGGGQNLGFRMGGAGGGQPQRYSSPGGSDLMSLLDGSGGGGQDDGGQSSMAAAAGGKFSQAGVRQSGGGGSGQEADAQVTFDESDFPSLGGGPGRPAGVVLDGMTHPGGPNGAASAAAGPQLGGASTVLNPDPYGALALGKGQEFNMQAEEFPALPGAPRPGPLPGDSEGGDAAKSEASGSQGQAHLQASNPAPGGAFQLAGQSFQGQGSGGPPGGLAPGHPNYEQMMRFYQQQQAARAGGDGAQASGSNSAKPGGQQGGAPDRFGLLGLLSVIRMTDPDLTTLALGTDLTTLGLNLNAPDSLHKTFASPWADGPLKAEPEFKVPKCYLHTPPRLQPGYFAKFQQDTLFYIFYSMPGDEAQLLAADELAARQWWYHKEFKLWLTRIPNTEPIMKTERFERGSYLVFDTATWDAVRKDNFVVHYDSIERQPSLARPPGLAASGVAPGGGPGGASALKPGGVSLAPGSAL